MINFLYAVKTGNKANILDGERVTLLLPEIIRRSTGVDKITGVLDGIRGVLVADTGEEYDLYELIAIWNRNVVLNNKGDGRGPAPLSYGRTLGTFIKEDRWLKTVDRSTEINRRMGIEVGCTNKDTDRLIYPLKLVPAGYTGQYEDTRFPSYADPFHGFMSVTWNEVINHFTFRCSEEYKYYFTGGVYGFERDKKYPDTAVRAVV